MKVLACIILAIGSVTALRSGPYLPSGWKPDGPAFLLPSEVAKPITALINEDTIAESEAAGSDFLREYGPPKVQDVSQDLTQQALPDMVTEQSFAVIEAKFNKDEITDAVTEETTQQNFGTEQTVTATEQTVSATEQTVSALTESEVIIEEKTVAEPEQLVRGKSINVYEQTEASLVSNIEEETTENVAEIVTVSVTETQETENANSNIISGIEEVVEKEVESEIKAVEEKVEKEVESEIKAVEEKVEKEVKAEIQAVNERKEKQLEVEFKAVEERVEKEVEVAVKEVDGEVRNIAEALVNLENEIKAQQAETVQEVAEIKTVQENSGALEQVPEGFLEYGPPGFREYGPPKDELLRSEAVVEANPETEAVESNETRRRRFSPKFKQ